AAFVHVGLSQKPSAVARIPNGDFERGLEGWRIDERTPMSRLSTEQVFSGKHSLHIADREDKVGSAVTATRIPFRGMAMVAITGQVYPVSGGGLGVYVRQFDEKGVCISGESHVFGLGGSGKKWTSFRRVFYTFEATRSLELHFHSYMAARCDAYLDNLAFERVQTSTEPPWKGTYKLRLGDVAKLTAADVIGPDGIVYPNWTKCGVQGGIPSVPVKARLADHGGRPDDDTCDADALDAACDAVAAVGGGAVFLESGVYHLDRQVTIRHSNVVIRGAGRDQTRIMFRYALPESGIRIYTPPANAIVGPDARMTVHAFPKQLQKIVFSCNDVVLRTWNRGKHSGNTFSATASLRSAFAKTPEGPGTLRAVATYSDGKTRAAEVAVTLDRGRKGRDPVPADQAAIGFLGLGLRGVRRPLAKDGLRGSFMIELEDVGDLVAGDCLLIDGPATKRWKDLTRNVCRWGNYRRYEARIESVVGKKVVLEQPLRLKFPVIDGSYVQKIEPITHCGVEDLTIEQTQDLWINTVEFRYGWNCWARNVRVVKCGRFPIHGVSAKWCEIRDCIFDDAWFKGGGGTAYAGWQNCFDCLIDGLKTTNFRHAPLFQWAASGCVIRNGVFINSDGQWHSGWTNENLMENCVIVSKRGHGSYGFGMWASPPEDTAHGPNGPRNVVYNCDVRSQKTGLWMGGMNENWLILHNRYIVESGYGIFAKTASFDHIVKGNVFVLQDAKFAGINLQTPDCIGVELIDNVLYGGNGVLTSGMGKPTVSKGNKVYPLPTVMPPRPMPAVPSIYAWQQANATTNKR
ncbi:MAG: right-handed parallel beta-helix repeat-containing protein, partial [Lentisphaeria bacterium]|nr:right-handed parallel beta-helix repeat-containing protein [Lentisphaeria bacterium]